MLQKNNLTKLPIKVQNYEFENYKRGHFALFDKLKLAGSNSIKKYKIIL